MAESSKARNCPEVRPGRSPTPLKTGYLKGWRETQCKLSPTLM